MGTTHKSSRTNRRNYQPTVVETKRGSSITWTSDRREIQRIGHKRMNLRRLERILLPPDERHDSHETWHSSTSQRMDHVERCSAEAVCEIPGTNINHPMNVRTESLESGNLLRMSTLSIRRTFLLNDIVAVFMSTDWSADVYRDARMCRNKILGYIRAGEISGILSIEAYSQLLPKLQQSYIRLHDRGIG
jgi:hypothetical protein